MSEDADRDRGQTAGGLTTAEAADRLGVRPRTVRRYIDQGKLRTVGKVAGEGAVESWVIDAESVDSLAARQAADGERGPDRRTEGLTLSDSTARTLRMIVREELSAGQRALQPSDEERRERAERDARIEELLAAAPEARDLAERLGRAEAERDRLRDDLAAARETIEELEEELADERERGWWARLRGR